MFCRKGVLRNFAKFTGKHLCQNLFFNKVASLRSATLLKRRLWRRCFPVSFAKFLRTPFFKEHLRRLLLQVVVHQMQVSLVNLNGLFEAKSDKMDSYNDFLGQLLQLMEFISMYLKGSVSVKDNKIFYCCISQKKYFIPSNIARISKLIQ